MTVAIELTLRMTLKTLAVELTLRVRFARISDFENVYTMTVSIELIF